MAQAVQNQPSSQLRLEEMTRILDVAAELHAQDALVEQQLHLDAIKNDLRDRLVAGAKVAGEPLSEEQVDVAIAQYYDNLHAFDEPSSGVTTFLANAYVAVGWRLPLVATLCVLGGAAWLLSSFLL